MTRRAMQAAAMLGLNLEQEQRTPASRMSSRPLSAFRAPLSLLIGPSGCGKTTRLRQLAAQARAQRASLTTIDLDPRRETTPANLPLVDLFPGPVENAMRALARAGLAEGSCMVRTPSTLSAGQHFRLRLALAMAEPERSKRTPRFLLIDEFAATLDSATAHCVALLLRRFIDESPGTRAVIATHREELLGALRPERVVRVDEQRKADNGQRTSGQGSLLRMSAFRSPLPALSFDITPGTLADYHPLARHHYRAGTPATIVRVLTARLRQPTADSEQRTLSQSHPLRMSAVHFPLSTVGVLLISMPTLNASWRRRAWPARFNTRDKREDARRINHPETGVRCISRVIVDPRFRSLGLATRLVRAYLDDPLTTHTEAVAAMGRLSGFFEAAGMTRFDIPLGIGHARLLDLLEQFGIEPHELAAPTRAFARACARIGAPLLTRELLHWSRSSRAASAASRAASEPIDLFRAACRTLAATPAAFVSAARRDDRSEPGVWRVFERNPRTANPHDSSAP